jgi:hypothetical protein
VGDARDWVAAADLQFRELFERREDVELMQVLDVVMLQYKCLQVRAASGEHRDSGCVSE